MLSRRSLLRILFPFTLLLILLAAATPARAQGWSPPAEAQRCPSKWGAADTRGSANHVKPASVLAALQLVKSGQIIELGRVLEGTMPVFGTRRFDLHTKRTGTNPGRNRRGTNEEIVISEIGQVGTQLDAFPHQMIGGSFYNCVPIAGNDSRTGFGKLGVEHVGSLIARGVLIDVAALKGVPVLPDSYEITPQDLEQALARQKQKLKPGDAVIIHTGWGKLWNVDNARYVKSCPGIGLAAAEWLAKRDPLLVGADNWPVEVGPNPDPDLSLPVHQLMLVVHGIHLLENMKLDELAAGRIYEFAFMLQPLKIKGGTGSTVAPIAIR
jgi:kynurenine formamidase